MLKLQITQVSFVIFALFLFLLSYFFLTSKFFKQTEQTFETKLIDIFENLRNIIASYAKLSLYYSTTQNFRGETWPWIWNGFNPPEFTWLKECKEKLTTYFYNIYLQKFYTNLPVNVDIKKSNNCYFPDLSEDSVLSGKKDEGNFSVVCNVSEVKIAITTTVLHSFINSSNSITNNRYWYLYRKFYEWAKENSNKFVYCVCGLTSSCADCSSIENCYQGLLESLRQKFKDDEYVNCYTDPSPCCVNERGVACKREQSGCYFWSKDCYVPNKMECGLTVSFSHFENKEGEKESETKISASSEIKAKTCKWIENRIETRRSYICEDHKYFESTARGPNKIIFVAVVYSGLRNPMGCFGEVECGCNKDNAVCESCNSQNNFCEKCVLECKDCPITPCIYPKKNCYKCNVIKIDEKYRIIKCEKCEDDPNNCPA